MSCFHMNKHLYPIPSSISFRLHHSRTKSVLILSPHSYYNKKMFHFKFQILLVIVNSESINWWIETPKWQDF